MIKSPSYSTQLTSIYVNMNICKYEKIFEVGLSFPFCEGRKVVRWFPYVRLAQEMWWHEKEILFFKNYRNTISFLQIGSMALCSVTGNVLRRRERRNYHFQEDVGNANVSSTLNSCIQLQTD